MTKYFVITDVHSYYSIMIDALEQKGFRLDNKNHIIILCGDAFDRGSEAVLMYNFLKSMYRQKRLIYIRGNHEDLLIQVSKLITSKEYIYGNRLIPSHHYSNGTVDTCEQFLKANIEIKDVVKFINKVTVNYYELDNYVFCHGWIPTKLDLRMQLVLNKNVDNFPWTEYFRWANGMEDWAAGNYLADKTTVCGHWHCNWGNYKLHKSIDKEWPEKDDPEFAKYFEPFIDNGIIALDACTAYSGIINVLVIESK